ncbi:hypothetical protein [Streptomyces sp. NPDC048057]|uniref:hypothetical protein n=1 Tax=Streptomyces sp. NPDC048057 TaxID=3155628 RepID=UPI0034022466
MRPRRPARQRNCAAVVALPAELMLDALEVRGPGGSEEVATVLVCELGEHSEQAEHAGDAHAALVRPLPIPHPGSLWARWRDGVEPEELVMLADCNTPNGAPPGQDDTCFLPLGHTGRCSFEIDYP